MAVYGVYINNLDLRLPRIALFATKDIQKGEELTFDYNMTGVILLFLSVNEYCKTRFQMHQIFVNFTSGIMSHN